MLVLNTNNETGFINKFGDQKSLPNPDFILMLPSFGIIPATQGPKDILNGHEVFNVNGTKVNCIADSIPINLLKSKEINPSGACLNRYYDSNGMGTYKHRTATAFQLEGGETLFKEVVFQSFGFSYTPLYPVNAELTMRVGLLKVDGSIVYATDVITHTYTKEIGVKQTKIQTNGIVANHGDRVILETSMKYNSSQDQTQMYIGWSMPSLKINNGSSGAYHGPYQQLCPIQISIE